jgi:hypothetical protein
LDSSGYETGLALDLGNNVIVASDKACHGRTGKPVSTLSEPSVWRRINGRTGRTGMSAPQVEFIALVEATVARQGYSGEWLPDAMKVIHLVPHAYQPPAASSIFCRWLFKQEAHILDALMLRILCPRK